MDEQSEKGADDECRGSIELPVVPRLVEGRSVGAVGTGGREGEWRPCSRFE